VTNAICALYTNTEGMAVFDVLPGAMLFNLGEAAKLENDTQQLILPHFKEIFLFTV